MPLGLQFPVPQPNLSAVHAQTSGSMLYIPDIAPLPSRDELRALLAETVRQTTATAPHLKVWFDLIDADTQGKRPIEKFARWYPLQHYVRVIYARHADSLCDRQGAVAKAVGSFLELTEDQLRIDLREIRSRLGENWFRRNPAASAADQ